MNWSMLWERIKGLVRQPEMIAALATLIFGIIREFVPALAGTVNLEWIIAILGLLLGVGATRYTARRMRK